MSAESIGVYSGRDDLLPSLRKQCATLQFAEGDDRDIARVVVIDTDSYDRLKAPPSKSMVRVILCDAPPHGARRQGEMRIDRKSFLASPAEFLGFASDLVGAGMHATQLERDYEYLAEIQGLMALTDAEAVSSRITTEVLKILGLPKGTLFLHDPRLERYVASFSNDETYRETGEFLPGVPPGLLQKALASPERLAAEHEKGGGMIIMPLQVDEDLVGIIKVPLQNGETVSDESRAGVGRYLGAVAQVLGNIYQLTRSRDLAMRDDLTKAFNRRFFESYLDEEIERSRRYGALFSIIFLDLDDLKMVNNFYGHLSGSRTLQEVAKRILSAVRGIDKVVRFGGDEFCIILPQTDQEQAIAVANRVRRSMSSSVFMLEPTIEISITASFGIATYPSHAMTKEDLIRQADAAMYRVKSTTKNAVGIATVDDATRPAVQ